MKLTVLFLILFTMLLLGQDSTGTVTDIDGNVYKTVKIGDQWWMAENLRVTHYSNGDSIPMVTSDSAWASLSTGARCTYDNDESNANIYGYLYNWYAVNDDRTIAPVGWHVSTDEEWQILVNCLGGSSVAGGKLKETGTAHWGSPNTGAANESGFSALPGGMRLCSDGIFYFLSNCASFWSSTGYLSDYAWGHGLYWNNSGVNRGNDYKETGMSVRCVKD